MLIVNEWEMLIVNECEMGIGGDIFVIKIIHNAEKGNYFININ